MTTPEQTGRTLSALLGTIKQWDFERAEDAGASIAGVSHVSVRRFANALNAEEKETLRTAAANAGIANAIEIAADGRALFVDPQKLDSLMPMAQAAGWRDAVRENPRGEGGRARKKVTSLETRRNSRSLAALLRAEDWETLPHTILSAGLRITFPNAKALHRLQITPGLNYLEEEAVRARFEALGMTSSDYVMASKGERGEKTTHLIVSSEVFDRLMQSVSIGDQDGMLANLLGDITQWAWRSRPTGNPDEPLQTFYVKEFASPLSGEQRRILQHYARAKNISKSLHINEDGTKLSIDSAVLSKLFPEGMTFDFSR